MNQVFMNGSDVENTRYFIHYGRVISPEEREAGWRELAAAVRESIKALKAIHEKEERGE